MSSKSMRLKFKGDKPVKKKKRSHESSKKDVSRGDEEDALYAGNETAWVPAEQVTDLNGPTIFYQRFKPSDSSSPRYFCLTIDTNMHRVEASSLDATEPAAAEPSGSAGPASSADRLALLDPTLDLDGAQIVDESELGGGSGLPVPQVKLEPQTVKQVWVATRIPNSSLEAPRYTFKSCEQRFLTGEKTGKLSAMLEARGPQEEWTVVRASGASGSDESERGLPGVPLFVKSTHGTLLSLDEVAGGKVVIRSDFSIESAGEAPGPTERWRALVQWKFRKEARKRVEEDLPVNQRAGRFGDQSNVVNPNTVKRLGVSQVDVGHVVKRKGMSAEEMLDRRVKAKSDRTCK